MGRVSCWTLLVILAVSLSQLQIAEGCMCAPSDLKTQFCKADFVIEAVVRNPVTIDDYPFFGKIAYKARVITTFKACKEAQKALAQKSLWLHTNAMRSMCGLIDLTPNLPWILSGNIRNGNLTIHLCGLRRHISELTFVQRGDFKNCYDCGCGS